MSVWGDRDFRGPETKPQSATAPGSGVSDHRSKVHGKTRSVPLVDPVVPPSRMPAVRHS
jgi:hypothetical protein